MGWVVDHTGKARFFRPGYWGPMFRWPPLPIGKEVEITFNSFEPSFTFRTRRALICTTAAIPAQGMTIDDFMTLAHLTYPQGASINLGNAPWNVGADCAQCANGASDTTYNGQH